MYICKYNYKTPQTPEQDSETHFMCSSEPDGAAAGKHVVYYSLRRHLAAGGTDVNLIRCFPEPFAEPLQRQKSLQWSTNQSLLAFVYNPGDLT